MGRFDNTKFGDRIDTAAAARKALVDKMKNRPGDDDPEVARRRAEREAIVEARAKREAEKEEARRLQALKEAEEKAAREAAEAAERAAREQAEFEAELERQRQAELDKAAAEAARLERAGRILADEATRKAARDAPLRGPQGPHEPALTRRPGRRKATGAKR